MHLNTARRSLLSLLLPLGVAAQVSGTLTGTVVGEESTPLAEARIRMAGVGMVVSGKDGRFRLTGVSHGDHVLEVRRLGYREFLQPVTIRAGETLYVRVVLTLAPVPLNPATALRSCSTTGGRSCRRCGGSRSGGLMVTATSLITGRSR